MSVSRIDYLRSLVESAEAELQAAQSAAILDPDGEHDDAVQAAFFLYSDAKDRLSKAESDPDLDPFAAKQRRRARRAASAAHAR